jgi:hypothetical protein
MGQRIKSRDRRGRLTPRGGGQSPYHCDAGAGRAVPKEKASGKVERQFLPGGTRHAVETAIDLSKTDAPWTTTLGPDIPMWMEVWR